MNDVVGYNFPRRLHFIRFVQDSSMYIWMNYWVIFNIALTSAESVRTEEKYWTEVESYTVKLEQILEWTDDTWKTLFIINPLVLTSR
jgi:hypothetical protein